MTSFFVVGEPVAQGSMRLTKHGRIIHSNSKRLELWRERVASTARPYFPEPLFGPVHLRLAFIIERPNNQWRTGRFADQPSPRWKHDHTQPPDLDKLVRAVGDALTKVCWVDDAQITSLMARKLWNPGRGDSGVHIHISQPSMARHTEGEA